MYKLSLSLSLPSLPSTSQGDATKEEMDVATQLVSKAIIPVAEVVETEAPREITEDEAKFSAYQVNKALNQRLRRFLHCVQLVWVWSREF